MRGVKNFDIDFKVTKQELVKHVTIDMTESLTFMNLAKTKYFSFPTVVTRGV